MDLIAVRSFRDPASKIRVANPQHKCYVHKGGQFTIGEAKTLKEMAKLDEQNARLVAALFMAGCIAEATPENIGQVEAELKQDQKREQHAKELDARAHTLVVAQFQDLLTRAAELGGRTAAPVRAR